MARSPIGKTHEQAVRRRSKDPAYRAAAAKLAPYEHLARLVIHRRMKEGWTQAELAERLGTSHSVISRIESGQHPTSVTTLDDSPKRSIQPRARLRRRCVGAREGAWRHRRAGA